MGYAEQEAVVPNLLRELNQLKADVSQLRRENYKWRDLVKKLVEVKWGRSYREVLSEAQNALQTGEVAKPCNPPEDQL
jgi:cell shape-determining protein MreC